MHVFYASFQTFQKYATDGLRIEVIAEERYEDMANFIRDHYAPDEPTGKSLNLKWDTELRDVIIAILKQNISVALIEVETDEILAGQAVTIENKLGILEPASFKSEALAKVFGLVNDLDKLCNVYDHYKVENIIHLWQLATHKDHRHKGFATKLITAMLEAFRILEMGPMAIKVECTHNGSKRVFEKLGFEALAEIKFAVYMVDGKQAFTNTGEHNSGVLYGKLT